MVEYFPNDIGYREASEMHLNVLLMDDDPAAYLVYERIIRDRFGQNVTLDHCRDETILDDVLRKKTYAAVILDQRLSNGTLGLQLVPLIRRESPGTRILLNSAFGDENLASQAIDSNVDAYILGRKQDDDELLRVLDRELNKFFQIETLTSQLNGHENGDIRRKCAELSDRINKKKDEVRAGRESSSQQSTPEHR
jgi:DNA-binding NarL/FixJ family response regulator